MWRRRRREGGDVLKDKKKALARICVLVGPSPRHRMLYSHIGSLSWSFKAVTSVGSVLNTFDWSLFSAHQGLSVDSIDQTLHITYPHSSAVLVGHPSQLCLGVIIVLVLVAQETPQ